MEITHKTCETLDTISTEDYVSMTYHETPSRLVTQLLPCPWALPWTVVTKTLVESEEESVGLNRNHSNYAHI